MLPDGSVHHGLTGLKKDNRGPSLDQLLIGAEGTLGIVTAARLRLVPAIDLAQRRLARPGQPASRARDAARARADDRPRRRVRDLARASRSTRCSPTSPAPARRWPTAIRGMRWSKRPPTMPPPSRPPTLAALLAPLLERGLIADAAIAASEAQAEAMWRIRDSLSEAERAAFGPATQHDISVAVDAMPALPGQRRRRGRGGLPRHPRLGLRPSRRRQHPFPCPRREARDANGWIEREGPAVSRLVHDLVTAAGGSISAEHGIGQMKRDELARLDPARVAAPARDQGRARPRGDHEPGETGLAPASRTR